MTKKQKKIYNWLIERPGYLKKSVDTLINTIDGDVDYNDAIIALKEARIVHRNKFIPKDRIIKEIVKSNPRTTPIFKTSKTIVRDDLNKPTPIRKLTTPGLYFVFGCVHAPFHNAAAFQRGIFPLLKDNREHVVGIILAGDFLDMNSLSSHDKGKKPIQGVTLDWEYKEGSELIDGITSDLASNIHKIYLFGNHEDRYFRYMNDIDNSKLGKSLPSPETGLDLQKKGFNVLTNWKEDHITLGNYLDVSHGEFINIHTAKKHIDTYRRSTLFYHTHRVQQYIEGQVGGYNGGSMADFNQPVFNYASRAMKGSWLNGFTAVYVDNQGFYHVQQIVCYNNSFIFGNKLYKY